VCTEFSWYASQLPAEHQRSGDETSITARRQPHLDAAHIRPQSFDTSSFASMNSASWSAATEQKYPVLLEYAKASFERIKQRLRHLWALARVKRVPSDYTLASDLDRQFGDLPVGLRKILLSIIHARTRAASAAQLKISNVPHFCSRVWQLNV
jgi:hypothetical protein